MKGYTWNSSGVLTTTTTTNLVGRNCRFGGAIVTATSTGDVTVTVYDTAASSTLNSRNSQNAAVLGKFLAKTGTNPFQVHIPEGIEASIGLTYTIAGTGEVILLFSDL